MAADFTVVHQLHPRFRDTDAMGHINNAAYITYLEVGRQDYWQRLVPGSNYREVPFILAHVSCDFRSEALVSEILEVALRCEWIGAKSFAFRYVVREQASKRVVVEATTVQVCYDYVTKRSIPMPAGLRERIERFEGRALDRPVEAR